MFRVVEKKGFPAVAIVVASALVGVLIATLAGRRRWCLAAETYVSTEARKVGRPGAPLL